MGRRPHWGASKLCVIDDTYSTQRGRIFNAIEQGEGFRMRAAHEAARFIFNRQNTSKFLARVRSVFETLAA